MRAPSASMRRGSASGVASRRAPFAASAISGSGASLASSPSKSAPASRFTPQAITARSAANAGVAQRSQAAHRATKLNAVSYELARASGKLRAGRRQRPPPDAQRLSGVSFVTAHATVAQSRNQSTASRRDPSRFWRESTARIWRRNPSSLAFRQGQLRPRMNHGLDADCCVHNSLALGRFIASSSCRSISGDRNMCHVSTWPLAQVAPLIFVAAAFWLMALARLRGAPCASPADSGRTSRS